MASRYVLFTDVTDEELENIPIQDGQLVLAYPSGQFFLDEDNARYQVGGKTADVTLSKTSTNPLQNQAITNNIVNSLDDAKAVTKDNVFASTKVIKELAEDCANIEDMTQADYDQLTDEQKNDGTIRHITDAEEDYQTAGGVKYVNTKSGLVNTNVQDVIDEVSPKKITQAEYDALTEEQQNSANYIITDASSIPTASAITYSNTTSGLDATNVQKAIDEVNDSLVNKLEIATDLDVKAYIVKKSITLTATASMSVSVSDLTNNAETVASNIVSCVALPITDNGFTVRGSRRSSSNTNMLFEFSQAPTAGTYSFGFLTIVVS